MKCSLRQRLVTSSRCQCELYLFESSKGNVKQHVVPVLRETKPLNLKRIITMVVLTHGSLNVAEPRTSLPLVFRLAKDVQSRKATVHAQTRASPERTWEDLKMSARCLEWLILFIFRAREQKLVRTFWQWADERVKELLPHTSLIQILNYRNK